MGRKAITLIGMSGVGKTHLSGKLAEWGWAHYSCDLEIARTIFPDDPNIKADDISRLSGFLGKLGDPENGGTNYETFRERQQIYYKAEEAALEKLAQEVECASPQNFIHDSTGSFCEILDEGLIQGVARETRIVYIKASDKEERELIRRAKKYPKPLFFPPQEFDRWLDEYLAEQNLESWAQMNPDGFARWVFPKLLEWRKPKYQAIADKHGVTVSSSLFQDMRSEREFLNIVEQAGVRAA